MKYLVKWDSLLNNCLFKVRENPNYLLTVLQPPHLFQTKNVEMCGKKQRNCEKADSLYAERTNYCH